MLERVRRIWHRPTPQFYNGKKLLNDEQHTFCPPELCARHAGAPQTCERHAKDMRKTCERAI
jgi:hypothetical protein